MLVYGLHGDEVPELLAEFVEQTGVTFPVMHGNYTIIAFDFPVAGYPFPRHVVVGKDRVVRSIRNDLDVAGLSDELEQLLAE